VKTTVGTLKDKPLTSEGRSFGIKKMKTMETKTTYVNQLGGTAQPTSMTTSKLISLSKLEN
jgi:hypothetical protein